jgi:hypothetical protein
MTGIAARSTMKSFAMKTSGNRAAHVKSTVLVAVALTVAILLAVSLLIATGTRGEGAARPAGNSGTPGGAGIGGARLTRFEISFDPKHRKALPIRSTAS